MVFLPLTMVDSGIRVNNGRVDFYNVYKEMVETALARPAEADIQALWWRSGHQIEVFVTLTNLRADTLGDISGEELNLFAVVYEGNRVKLTNRFVRAVVARWVTSLAPDESRTFQLVAPDLVDVDWEKLHVVVMVDLYQPPALTFDMLQAAIARHVEPSLTVSPDALTFVVDPSDATVTPAQVAIAGGGFFDWTAAADQPWIAISPTSGALLSQVLVAVDREALTRGWQEGIVTFTATDAAFSDTVAVRAYLGEVNRLYVPVTI